MISNKLANHTRQHPIYGLPNKHKKEFLSEPIQDNTKLKKCFFVANWKKTFLLCLSSLFNICFLSAFIYLVYKNQTRKACNLECDLNSFFMNGVNCETKLKHNESCLADNWCRNDLALKCISSSCQCDTPLKYWNGANCSSYKLYNETCLSQLECSKVQETICLNSHCNCNLTSHYFDSLTNKCVLQLNENSNCSQDMQCHGELVCLQGMCSCLNSTTHYYRQSTLSCFPKTLSNTFCSTNLTCRSDLGLSCVSSMCQCDATSTWDGVKCELLNLCPSGWVSNSGSCYYISPKERSFTNAKNYCISLGGSLVIFKTLNEYNSFKSIIPNDKFFIGLEKVGGNWFWIDGSVFDNTMWESGKPGSDSCGRYSGNGIEDRSCNDEERFVCERR